MSDQVHRDEFEMLKSIYEEQFDIVQVGILLSEAIFRAYLQLESPLSLSYQTNGKNSKVSILGIFLLYLCQVCLFDTKE